MQSVINMEKIKDLLAKFGYDSISFTVHKNVSFEQCSEEIVKVLETFLNDKNKKPSNGMYL